MQEQQILIAIELIQEATLERWRSGLAPTRLSTDIQVGLIWDKLNRAITDSTTDVELLTAACDIILAIAKGLPIAEYSKVASVDIDDELQETSNLTDEELQAIVMDDGSGDTALETVPEEVEEEIKVPDGVSKTKVTKNPKLSSSRASKKQDS